ncbi:hypothetical protein CH298_16010 [Rhodococcoides fascians]|uniref:hypothetical protein n=1 Tax=Rhodococcoides fascians TaxID=1828 RepID=UPI000B9A5B98|nr:hypothetical protein [Rhodococcus fascians]OZE88753.1 hypothetical protein CH303_15890 [Rhodococcus fascians]OZF16714.1 hypothetical protein CH298_16010 [Rhodococcus fascians]OZF19733.1 hypothetical protein CH297_15910 [Rhodococcus fascians]OZF65997.1 hypothetical protein CH308_15810 [Rhodococcus fascians]OZF69149.1 hypothetical protein CH307_16005 [Rhodococcus fascians]
MPPQRRKIVPPTTTSKVRRKVAGTAKPTSAETDAPAPETTAPETAAPDTTAAETAVGTTPASEKPRLDKTDPVETDTATTAPATTQPAETQPVDTQQDKSRPSRAGLKKPVAPTSTSTETTESPKSASGIGFKHVIVVAVIAVVLGAFAAVAAFKPFATIDNKAWVDSSATQEVTSAATDALQTLYTYKAETIDADFDAARAVLNQSMLDEFNSTADTTKSAVVQTDTGTEAMVTDIGVSRLEDDKAELIANVNISATQNGVASGSAEGPLTVNMEKIDGTWKLSAIDDQ